MSDKGDANSLSEESSSSMSSVTGTTGREEKSEGSDESSLARAESIRVRRSKRIVTACIATAAVLVGIAAYLSTRNAEKDDFESQVRFPNAKKDFAVR